MMLTDSHCHLASHRFPAEEIPDILSRSRAAGVTRIVTLTTSLNDVEANLAFTTEPEVHTCIGIHPCDVHHAPDDAIVKLSAFTDHPGVCGIGETGLDYFHPAPDGWPEEVFRSRQHEFLRLHFEMAATSGLNLAIHTRDRQGHASLDDALAIYQDYHRAVRAVFHCFIHGWDQAERVLALGGLVSFGGVSTFKNARDVRDTILRCPAGSLMLETDAPYLAPEPHRGQRNEPSYVSHTADFIANLRQESRSELEHHTNTAAERFFRFRSNSI